MDAARPVTPAAAPTEHLLTAADPLVLTDAARHAPTAVVRPAPTAAVPSEAAAQTATTAVAPGARLHGSLA